MVGNVVSGPSAFALLLINRACLSRCDDVKPPPAAKMGRARESREGNCDRFRVCGGILLPCCLVLDPVLFIYSTSRLESAIERCTHRVSQILRSECEVSSFLVRLAWFQDTSLAAPGKSFTKYARTCRDAPSVAVTRAACSVAYVVST